MNIEVRNTINRDEKKIVKDILSIENDMWYSDIDLNNIKVLVDSILLWCWSLITYPDNSKELALVSIKKEFQNMWYWKILIKHIIWNQKNIYVICEKEKENLYNKFDFKFINDEFIPWFILKKLIDERIRFPEDNSICMKYIK